MKDALKEVFGNDNILHLTKPHDYNPLCGKKYYSNITDDVLWFQNNKHGMIICKDCNEQLHADFIAEQMNKY